MDTKSDQVKDATAAISDGANDPAKQPDISGGIIEASILKNVPMDHPAIDSNPRKGLPADSNRIDMNDPTFGSTITTPKA